MASQQRPFFATRVPGQPLDRSALRFNEAAVSGLLMFGFIVDQPWLVVFVATVVLCGALFPRLALFQRFYYDVLSPIGLLRPAPCGRSVGVQQFTEWLVGIGLLGASLALLGGDGLLGWALALAVSMLAVSDLIFGFCVCCFVYLKIRRWRGGLG